jgi:hypothetical protein
MVTKISKEDTTSILTAIYITYPDNGRDIFLWNSVTIYKTSLSHTLKYHNPYFHRCDNLKPHI